MNIRTLARLGAVPTAAAAVALAVAGPASAHVTITPSDTTAGAYTVLTVNVPHGCDGSATTKIDIQIPKELVEVKPTRNSFWDLKVVTSKLDKPLTAEDGDAITERVSEIVYTAKTPLPDTERDAFELSLQLPDEAGKTLEFPTIQTCEQGKTAWTEIPAAGEDPFSLEHPAPFVTTTASASDDTDATPSATPSASASAAPADDAMDMSSDDSDDSSSGLAITGLVAGLLGLAAGVVALVRTRGRGQA